MHHPDLPYAASPILWGKLSRCMPAVMATLLLLTGQPVAAAEPSDVMGLDMRLIAGPVEGAKAKVGLALDLRPGWTTYWRYPGDSGVPPEIDTSGSTNIAGVTIGFPPPERIIHGPEQTIGYRSPVTLLLDVTLTDPAKPAHLTMVARAGACRDVCLPVEATLDLELDPKVAVSPSDRQMLAAVESSLPKPVKAGEPFSVIALERSGATKPATVTFKVTAPATKLTDIFVEGPEGWALPLPERLGSDGTESIWRFALDGLPAKAEATGSALTFTLVGQGNATVQRWTLP